MKSPIPIYFAGKIGHNDWRHSIAPNLRGTWHGVCLNPALPEEIEPLSFNFADIRFEYVGPYMVGCDHGCFHGPKSHGILGANEPVDDRIITPGRYKVFNLCMEWINRAYVVFAHIEAADAHGTMFELGWAYERLPVFINFASDEIASECWFPARSALQISVNPDPVKALSNFLPSLRLAVERDSWLVERRMTLSLK